jgi:hypothetical protein
MPFKKGQSGCPEKKLKPGQSGNPNGRPHKLPEIDKLMADLLGQGDRAEKLLKAIYEKAQRGDTRAAEILLNRGYGKPKESIEHSGEINVKKNIDLSNLSDDELRTLDELQRKAGTGKEKNT